jgi:hypothetical protein
LWFLFDINESICTSISSSAVVWHRHVKWLIQRCCLRMMLRMIQVTKTLASSLILASNCTHPPDLIAKMVHQCGLALQIRPCLFGLARVILVCYNIMKDGQSLGYVLFWNSLWDFTVEWLQLRVWWWTWNEMSCMILLTNSCTGKSSCAFLSPAISSDL